MSFFEFDNIHYLNHIIFIIRIYFSYADDFTFSLFVNDNPNPQFTYSSRNEYLNGNDSNPNINGYIADLQSLGEINVFLNTPYAQCTSNQNMDTMVYIARGGDNVIGTTPEGPNGETTNFMTTTRFAYSFEREKGQNDNDWKLVDYVSEVQLFARFFVPVPSSP